MANHPPDERQRYPWHGRLAVALGRFMLVFGAIAFVLGITILAILIATFVPVIAFELFR